MAKKTKAKKGRSKVNTSRTSFNFGANVRRGGRRGRKGGGS